MSTTGNGRVPRPALHAVDAEAKTPESGTDRGSFEQRVEGVLADVVNQLDAMQVDGRMLAQHTRAEVAGLRVEVATVRTEVGTLHESQGRMLGELSRVHGRLDEFGLGLAANEQRAREAKAQAEKAERASITNEVTLDILADGKRESWRSKAQLRDLVARGLGFVGGEAKRLVRPAVLVALFWLLAKLKGWM